MYGDWDSFISTHTPLAGRDAAVTYAYPELKFQLTRPSRGATKVRFKYYGTPIISTHTPLAGRDEIEIDICRKGHISTHTPLAGRDENPLLAHGGAGHFNSHAPRGARPTAAPSAR